MICVPAFKHMARSALFTLVLLWTSGCAHSTDEPTLISAELRGVQFKSGRPRAGDRLEDAVAEPLVEQLNALRIDVDALTTIPILRAEILGFTDTKECTGIECDELALRRATVVYGWLVRNGVRRSSLKEPKGYGHMMPIDDNETDEGRSRNRRTEVNIVPTSYPDY